MTVVEAETPWTVQGHRARRSERLRTRETARRVVRNPRVRSCGMLPTARPDGWDTYCGEVEGARVATIVGPGLCGAVNLCRWCSAPVRNKRACECEAQVQRFLGAGGTVWLVTPTTGPVDGETIPEAGARLRATFAEWSSGGGRARWNAAYGQVATHRSFECMLNVAEWRAHFHFHVLVFLTAVDASSDMVAMIRLRRLWHDAAAKFGATVHPDHGFDISPIQLNPDGTTSGVGSYVAKSAGTEAARGDLKKTRGSSMSFFELVDAFEETGDTAYRGLAREFEEAVQRIPPLLWSRHALRRIDEFVLGTMTMEEPVVDEFDEPEGGDIEEVPTGMVPGSRAVAHVNAVAARWFAEARLIDAVHLVVEGAPSDDLVPAYLRDLARARGAPAHVVDGIGPPRDDY